MVATQVAMLAPLARRTTRETDTYSIEEGASAAYPLAACATDSSTAASTAMEHRDHGVLHLRFHEQSCGESCFNSHVNLRHFTHSMCASRPLVRAFKRRTLAKEVSRFRHL